MKTSLFVLFLGKDEEAIRSATEEDAIGLGTYRF